MMSSASPCLISRLSAVSAACFRPSFLLLCTSKYSCGGRFSFIVTSLSISATVVFPVIKTLVDRLWVTSKTSVSKLSNSVLGGGRVGQGCLVGSIISPHLSANGRLISLQKYSIAAMAALTCRARDEAVKSSIGSSDDNPTFPD